MSEFAGKMQSGLRKSSSDIFTFMVKFLSGAFLALTLALIVQEILGHHEGENLISFIFVIVIATAVFLRVSKKWNLTGVLIFDLICVLIGMILRLYIIVAPGA